MLHRLRNIFKIEIDYSSRIFGFDVLRGFAIIIVLYTHGRTKLINFTAINQFVSIIAFWTMDMFFVLSGYLIGTMLIKTYVRDADFTGKSAYNFWIRRWFRTLPNYYLLLFGTALLWLIIDGNKILFRAQFLADLFFCQSILSPPSFFLMESWSLCIEEWFYLLFPLCLIAGEWILSYTKLNNIDKIKYNILACILFFYFIPLILRIHAYTLQPRLTWYDVSRMTFHRIDAVSIGITFAWIDYFYKGFLKKIRIILLFVFVISFSVYIYYNYIVFGEGYNRLFPLSAYIYYYLLTAISAFSLCVYMKDFKIKQVNWFVVFISYWSITSYSCYIFHRSVVMYLVDAVFKTHTPMQNIPLFLLYATGSILLSIIVYKYFEHPMTELREKWKIK